MMVSSSSPPILQTGPMVQPSRMSPVGMITLSLMYVGPVILEPACTLVPLPMYMGPSRASSVTWASMKEPLPMYTSVSLP